MRTKLNARRCGLILLTKAIVSIVQTDKVAINMKIIIVGANGAVGRTAVDALSGRHESEDVGLAYSKAVEGCLTGQVFIVD
jgi:uncharacterized YccA/Bax inhibitor family protein